MSAIPKKKICWHCEGRVSLTQENCPFCGVYLSPSESGKESLLNPPYRLVESEEESVPLSPYSDSSKNNSKSEEQSLIPQTEVNSDHIKNIIISIAFLLAGTVFLIFGVVLWLFSDRGTLTLHWNAHYWYLYLLSAVPLLIWGWLSLQKIPE